MSIGEHEMRHDLLVYDSDYGFAGALGLFVEEGIEAGHPVLLVTNADRREVVTDTLSAADAEKVTFVDGDRFYTRPEAAIAGYDAKLRELLGAGAEAVRVYGELPHCRNAQERESWLRYEAIVNRAFAGQPVWVMCGYDTRALPAQVVDDAWRGDREVHAQGWCENPHYEDPEDVLRALAPAPVELAGLRSLPLVEDEGTLRRLLSRELASEGLDAETASRMLEAAAAVLDNAERYAGGLRSLRAGRSQDRFVCEMADGGPGLDDPFAGYTPPRKRRDPTGLWRARQLTARLDLLSSGTGLTVRLWA
jgi:hypothetical protein